MKTRILTFMFAASLLATGSAFAQQSSSGEGTTGSVNLHCFSANNGNAAVRYCVSQEGNVTEINSPAGFEHSRVNVLVEGYVVCAGTTPLNYDLMGSQSGWGAGITVAGPSGTSITVRRFSTNGQWQLDQKFQFDKKELDFTVTATLKNLGVPVNDVRLARHIDFDNDNTSGDDMQTYTERGVLAMGNAGHGVSLTGSSFNTTLDRGVAAALGSPTCSPAVVASPTLTDGDTVLTYRLGNLGTGKKAIVIWTYRRH